MSINMRSVLIGMAILIGASSASTAQTSTDKVAVFVRSGAAGGFTDPSQDRQDSMKDVVKKLKGSDALRTVDSEREAMLILEVLDRETKRESNLWGRQNKSYLTVRLIVGEYTAEFAGESGSKGMMKGYGAAAGKVVDQLETWVKANREKLLTATK